MAYILRSMAVIGVIAFHSPVLSEKSPPAPASRSVAAATPIAVPAASRGLDIASLAAGRSATREAMEILSGLDPETRQRLLDLGMRAVAGR